jgi:hypothetical protein
VISKQFPLAAEDTGDFVQVVIAVQGTVEAIVVGRGLDSVEWLSAFMIARISWQIPRQLYALIAVLFSTFRQEDT